MKKAITNNDLAQLIHIVIRRLDGHDKKFDAIDKRFEAMDQKFELKITALTKEVYRQGKKLNDVELELQRQGALAEERDTRIDIIAQHVNSLTTDMQTAKVDISNIKDVVVENRILLLGKANKRTSKRRLARA